MCHHAAEVWRADCEVQGSEASRSHPNRSTCSSSQPMVHSADTGMADNGSSPQSAFSTSAFCAAELQLQQAKVASEKDSAGFAGVCSWMWLNDACSKGSSGCWDSQPLTVCSHGSQSPALVAAPKGLPAQVAAAGGAG